VDFGFEDGGDFIKKIGDFGLGIVSIWDCRISDLLMSLRSAFYIIAPPQAAIKSAIPNPKSQIKNRRFS